MRRNLRLLFATLCCAALVISAGGQSGRKQKKADPQPPVQGVNQPELRTQPEPEAEVEPKKEKEKEKGPSLMVMSDLGDMNIPMYYTDTAREGCVTELRDLLKSGDIRESRNQSRSDAIKTAKEEEKTYVVYLELTANGMGTMGGIDLRYMIYEPKTAKVAGSGSGYPAQPSRGSMPPIGANRMQMYLDWAGRDVARQVIKRLGLHP